MAIESVTSSKWEGKNTAKLNKSTTPQEVWPFLEDFCSLHKWLPSIDTCRKVEGSDGIPGLVRYCAATVPPPEDGGEVTVRWCHEKLLAIDHVTKCISYEILDNNMGIKSYKSTIKVLPVLDGCDDLYGCLIEWSFLADPIEGVSLEDMVAYLDLSLKGMARNIEKALESSN